MIYTHFTSEWMPTKKLFRFAAMTCNRIEYEKIGRHLEGALAFQGLSDLREIYDGPVM